jgi:thymidylate kinase/predicted NUDIX family phosphoesterase
VRPYGPLQSIQAIADSAPLTHRAAYTAQAFSGLNRAVSTASISELKARSLELKPKAEALLSILHAQARRPYFVELAGTPKAGKTTALHVLDRFLKSCGYRVDQMRERAADCPIAMKGHFFFNTWTTTTMLASMIESLESKADVVLLDRGVFDALVWLEMQSQEHQISPEERQVFREFVLLDRWRALTDLTVVLRVSPAEAVSRENKDLLLDRTGSIMEPRFLERYNDVLSEVRASVQDEFTFVDIDTDEHRSPADATFAIATKLLDHMRRWADPEIAAIPRAVAEELFRNGAVLPLPEAFEGVQRAVTFRRRSDLERDDGFVQLVGAAVLRHSDELLLLRRDEERDKKRKAFGRDVLWKGCHVAGSPADASNLLGNTAMAIKARLKEDFHLAWLDSEPIPRFLVWNRDDDNDARHLGVLFDLEIRAPELARLLSEKVFKRERDRTKLSGSRFVAPSELLDRLERKDDIELEFWSREILRHVTADRSQ